MVDKNNMRSTIKYRQVDPVLWRAGRSRKGGIEIMGKYTNADTSKQSGNSSSKVSEAGHNARDDAEKDGLFERGNSSKNSERFSKTDESGERATGFWDSIFGSKK